MAIKVKSKTTPSQDAATISNTKPAFVIQPITGASPPTPNIIIRAIKIMLMDIRMKLYPKQTSEELEKYSQFADLVYRRY